ncbi:MAG: FxsA family protein [Akkermansiaceae bacterium]|nr:FxsA family protein [Akkermansiaceae bacterium]
MFGKLLLLFILVPTAELYLFIKIGSRLGLGPTLAIIIVTAVLGASLTKSQGRRAIEKFQAATTAGRMPAKEAIDGLMILLAGAVLITPGFLTDTVGFLLLLPSFRAIVAGYAGKRLKGKIQVVTPGMPNQSAQEQKPESKLDDGNVIDV